MLSTSMAHSLVDAAHFVTFTFLPSAACLAFEELVSALVPSVEGETDFW